MRLPPLVRFRVVCRLQAEVNFPTIRPYDLRFLDDVSRFGVPLSADGFFCHASRWLLCDVDGCGVRLVDGAGIWVLAELRFVVVDGSWCV